MAIHNFFIKGTFLNGISGPVGAAIGSLNRLFAASNRVARGAILGSPAAFGVAANRARAAANVIVASGQRAQRAWMFGGGRGGGGGGGARGGRGFAPFQQSLAALGGYGYALGRGGPATLAMLAPAVAAHQGYKKFADYEDALYEVRKAANLTREETRKLGIDLEATGRKYAVEAPQMAQMATEFALAGARGPENILAMTEEAAKSLLTWQKANPQKTANNLAKMWSLWNRGDTKGAPMHLSKFVDAVDYLEDNFPTSSEQIMKSFERFMPTAKSSGMSPEQAAAVSTALMVSGPGSGERAGTRLAINWARIEGAIRGDIKKKGFNPNVTKDVRSMLDQNPMLGVLMWMDDLRKKFKGAKGWERKARAIIAKGLGFESAKNIEPLFADFGSTVSIASQFDQATARWAVKQDWFRKRLGELGEQGEELLKVLDKWASAADGAPAPYIGTASKNARMMAERARHQSKKMHMAWERMLRSFGEWTNQQISWTFPKIEGAMDAISKEFEKRIEDNASPYGSHAKEIGGLWSANLRKIQGKRGTHTGAMSTETPNVPYNQQAEGVPGAITRHADGQALTEAERWIRAWDKNRRDPETEAALDAYLKNRSKNQGDVMSLYGIMRSGSLPANVSGAVNNPPLTSWPAGVPTSPPPIINYAAPQPMVINIPPPNVTVTHTQPAGVQVHVTVSGGIQTLMRNPGASAASGQQGDPSDATGRQ